MTSPQVWLNSDSEHSFVQSDCERHSAVGRKQVVNENLEEVSLATGTSVPSHD